MVEALSLRPRGWRRLFNLFAKKSDREPPAPSTAHARLGLETQTSNWLFALDLPEKSVRTLARTELRIPWNYDGEGTITRVEHRITVPGQSAWQFKHSVRTETISLRLAIPKIHGRLFPLGKEHRKHLRRPDEVPRTAYRDEPGGAIRRPQGVGGEEPLFGDELYALLLPPLREFVEKQFQLPGNLYDYQYEGLRFLVERRYALLADDMGLGKTVQAILSLKILMYAGAVKRALVICPASLKTNWVREFEKWASDLRLSVIEGNPHQRAACFNRPAHVYITNYEKFSSKDEERNDLKLVRERPFDLVIIDEAQRIKNPGSQMAQNVKRIPRSYSWALTGTPLENRVEDLISVFGFVKQGLLKELDAQRPFTQIKQTIAPYFLRRKKADVLKQLPPKRYEEQWVELSDEQRSAYVMAEHKGLRNLKELGQQITIQHVFALIIHLKQICNFEVRSGASSKAELLQDELEEIVLSGDKAIIFSQFKETIDYLQTRLGKSEVKFQTVCLHGELTMSQRDSAIARFKGEGFPVFLITTRAGGVGLNLAEASYVYHFDRLWNPAAERQAEDRAHRIGQTKSLLVTSIMAKDTIEERICKVLKRKQKLFDELIDSDYGSYERALSPEDAFEVLGLDRALAQVALRKKASG